MSGVGVTSGCSGPGVGINVTESGARSGVGPRGVAVFGTGESNVEEMGCGPGVLSSSLRNGSYVGCGVGVEPARVQEETMSAMRITGRANRYA